MSRGRWAMLAMGALLALAVAADSPAEQVQAPPATAKSGDTWVDPQDDAKMVYVPAGEFLMGSLEGEGASDEHPHRRVSLDAYWIDENLVTVAQYRKFCQAAGRELPPAPDWGWKDDHPIVNVTWEDARAYAAWVGKRLPTEAEWEKAARGTDGRQYPWGNEFDESRCVHASNVRSTQPAGSLPSGASPYGALDMAGNVWELCADWYDPDYYQSAPKQDPQGPTSGAYHILRGGCWGSAGESDFRSAYRGVIAPGDRRGYIGFRCVRGLS